MPKEYVMPKLAMAMNEGTINEWLVNNFDFIESGDPIVTVETEKVSYDCESPETGFFVKVANELDTVSCDSIIGYFCETEEEAKSLLNSNSEKSSEDSSFQTEQSKPVINLNESSSSSSVETLKPKQSIESERIIASPLAKKIASDKKLNLQLVLGSGPGGRIVKKDVLQAIESGLHLTTLQTSIVDNDVLIRMPITGMRKTISDRMQKSLIETAQLSSAWESDITNLLSMRDKLLEKEKLLGTRISVNTFIIKAICYAIRHVPIANSNREGNEIVVHRNVNIGIAIAIPGVSEYESGLVVAVLKNVDSMGLKDIDIEMKNLIKYYRVYLYIYKMKAFKKI